MSNFDNNSQQNRRRNRGGSKRDFQNERNMNYDDMGSQYSPAKRRKMYGDNPSGGAPDSGNSRPYQQDRDYAYNRRPPPMYGGYPYTYAREREYRRYPYGHYGRGAPHPPPPPPPHHIGPPPPHPDMPNARYNAPLHRSMYPRERNNYYNNGNNNRNYMRETYEKDNRPPYMKGPSAKKRRSRSLTPSGGSDNSDYDSSDSVERRSYANNASSSSGFNREDDYGPRIMGKRASPGKQRNNLQSNYENDEYYDAQPNEQQQRDNKLADSAELLVDAVHVLKDDKQKQTSAASATTPASESAGTPLSNEISKVDDNLLVEPKQLSIASSSASVPVVEESVEYGPALPSKDDVMAQISRLDLEITKVQIEIENAKKAKPLNKQLESSIDTPKKKKASPFAKNRVQQIYLENREKSRSANEGIEFLMYEKCAPFENVSLANNPIWKENNETQAKLLPDLEKLIAEKIEKQEKNLEENVNKYMTMKKQWKEKLRQHKRSPVVQQMLDEYDALGEVHASTRVLSHLSGRYVKTLAVVPRMLPPEERLILENNNNGLVEDPKLEWAERSSIERAWSQDDKTRFLHYLQMYQKDIKRVATHFPQKTMGDIVVYYYNNKKSTEFKKTMREIKRRYSTRRRIYDEGKKPSEIRKTELAARELRNANSAAANNNSNSNNSNNPNNNAANNNGLSAGENYLRPRTSRNSNKQYDDPEIANANSLGAQDTPMFTEWSDAEKSRFLELLPVHGKNFATIARYIKSKGTAQIKQYFNDNKDALQLESKLPKKKKSGQAKVGRPPKQASDALAASTVAAAVQSSALQAANVQQALQLNNSSAMIATSEDEDNGQRRGRKQTAKKSSTGQLWSAAEKETFFNFLECNGRNWKKLAEVLPTKTEAQIKALYQSYKVRLGLAVEKGVKKKKKKIRYLTTEITAENIAPDLCSFASVCEEVADKGEASFEDIAAQLIPSDDSLDEQDWSDGYTSGSGSTSMPKILPAPPMRPRMSLYKPRLGSFNAQPSLKFTSLNVLLNESLEADAKKTINQHELSNLDLLGSLAVEEGNNIAKSSRKSSERRSRTSMASQYSNSVTYNSNSTYSHQQQQQMQQMHYQQQYNLQQQQHYNNYSNNPASSSPPQSGSGSSRSTPEKQGDNPTKPRETAKTKKDKFFAGSTFTAPSNFYPQNLFMSQQSGQSPPPQSSQQQQAQPQQQQQQHTPPPSHQQAQQQQQQQQQARTTPPLQQQQAVPPIQQQQQQQQHVQQYSKQAIQSNKISPQKVNQLPSACELTTTEVLSLSALSPLLSALPPLPNSNIPPPQFQQLPEEKKKVEVATTIQQYQLQAPPQVQTPSVKKQTVRVDTLEEGSVHASFLPFAFSASPAMTSMQVNQNSNLPSATVGNVLGKTPQQ